ncbi:hypothetical protein Tco_0120697 [Tanacetum coccineum]
MFNNYPPDHPLVTSMAIPLVCIYQKQFASDAFVVLFPYWNSPTYCTDRGNQKIHCRSCNQEYDHLPDGCPKTSLFMNGDPYKKNLLSDQPLEGYEDQENPTSRLSSERTALYGLKQAPPKGMIIMRVTHFPKEKSPNSMSDDEIMEWILSDPVDIPMRTYFDFKTNEDLMGIPVEPKLDSEGMCWLPYVPYSHYMTFINANILLNASFLLCNVCLSLSKCTFVEYMAEQNVPNAQKIKRTPIFQISKVDILSNTNFYQAFTASANKRKNPAFQLVDEDDEAQQESIPHEEGNDPDLERAKKMSLEALQDRDERKGGVTIRDPVSETTSKLHEVVGKGKAVVTEEQVALIPNSICQKKEKNYRSFILARRDQSPPDSTTGPSYRPDDDTSEKVIHESSSTSDSERTESDTETAAPKDDKDQGEVDSSTVTSGMFGFNRSQVPTTVDNYLGTKLDDALLKSALFRHMNKIKSANRNTANYRLYHALMEALITDEDAMDKEVADKVKDHKRKHDSDDDEDDDDDEGPSAGSNQGSSKKPRESEASASKQHPALTSTGWQITDTREAGVDSSMHRSDPESEHSEQSSDDISMQDEGNDSDMEDTDNAHIPKVSTTTWFKPIPESERPATPLP